MSESTDWKAFFNPKLVFRYPVRSLAILCAAIGIIKSPLDFSDRYLAFGFFLLCLSFATNISRNVYRPSNISYSGERTPWIFSSAALFQCIVLGVLTVVFVLLCLHQLGLTLHLDAHLSEWVKAHILAL
jgi:hypothetical protein